MITHGVRCGPCDKASTEIHRLYDILLPIIMMMPSATTSAYGIVSLCISFGRAGKGLFTNAGRHSQSSIPRPEFRLLTPKRTVTAEIPRVMKRIAIARTLPPFT